MTRSPKVVPLAHAARVRQVVWALIVGAVVLGEACAARGHVIRGTVTVVDPTRIEIRHKSGQLVSVALTSGTTYRWDDGSASVNDVNVGARVLVVLDEPPSPFSAVEVRIFTRPHTTMGTPRSEAARNRTPLASSQHPAK